MKFKTGLLVGLGIGYLLGTRMGERAADPEVPMSSRARFVDDAAKASLRAIEKARETIQSRLGGETDATWN